MVRLAANHGIQIVMDAFETAGWMRGFLQENGIQKAFRYGKFLGNRYKNFTDIIWITELFPNLEHQFNRQPFDRRAYARDRIG